ERRPRPPRLVLAARGDALEHLDLDARGPQPLDPARSDRIRITGADHHAADAGSDHCVGARRRATVMIARLERHVERRASRTAAGLRERAHLGMGNVLLLVPALARSEEHTSELQSRSDLVCRLLLEKKKHEVFIKE